MVKNESLIDRVIRIALALVIAILYFSGTISGAIGIILLIVALVLLLTGIVGFCPLYALLKISTFKQKE